MKLLYFFFLACWGSFGYSFDLQIDIQILNAPELQTIDAQLVLNGNESVQLESDQNGLFYQVIETQSEEGIVELSFLGQDDSLISFKSVYNVSDGLAFQINYINQADCSSSFYVDLAVFNDQQKAPNELIVYNTSEQNSPVISWLWEFGTGEYSNHPTPQYQYSDFGPYELCFSQITLNGCASTVCDSISINESLALYSGFSITVIESAPTALIDSFYQLSYYPNPIHSSGTLNLSQNYTGEFQLYSISGSLLASTFLYNEQTINLSQFSLKAGIYILKLNHSFFELLIK